ncbi:MAG: FtsX-like permease family protein [Acutalibacter sp.]|nr:FtsX-like permease family protein [Acutalibacter sp.]
MNKELFGLSLQSLRRKKRSSLLLFAVLFLSFAFAIISLTVTGSMQKTNEEYRYDVYGEWYGAIPIGREEDEDFLRGQEWLDTLGITKSLGTIGVSTSGSTSIGTMDDTFLEIGRISLQDGRFPETADEIAMEADLLSAMGYDYTLGQEISFPVTIPFILTVREENSATPKMQTQMVSVERSYTLCGVIQEYSDLWVRSNIANYFPPLNSALISSEGAKMLMEAASEEAEPLWEKAEAILEEGHKVTGVALDEPVPQYYFTVLPGMEKDMKEQGDEYLRSMRTEPQERRVVINTVAYSGESEAIEGFYAGLILAVTLLAVICIYAIQIQDEARQLAIFRSIGITKRQLCVMLLYETMCLGVPAMLLGAGIGALGTWTVLRLAVYSGSAPIQVVVPPVLLMVTGTLWILGVLAARLAVFLVALRAPLTGRFHMARKKAKRYNHLRRGLIAALSVLLCSAVIFTVLESLDPIQTIRRMNTSEDYFVTQSGAGFYWPASHTLFPAPNEGYTQLDYTMPVDTVVPIGQIPGVEHTRGSGQAYARLEFDGMEQVPMASVYKEYLQETFKQGRGFDFPDKPLPYGIGPYDEEAMAVWIAAVNENDWKDLIDFSGIDMEKFRAGEQVLMSFPLSPNGKYAMGEYSYISLSGKDFEETGIEKGKTIRITAGTPETYGTVEAEVGSIVTFAPDADRGGAYALREPYSVICSGAFVERLLDAIGPKEPWNEFRQGTPYGHTKISIFVDQTADFLSTDAVLAEYCSRAELRLNADQRALNQMWTQRSTQTLVLLIPGGICVALVLLLILWNTLSMEAERKKRNVGIQQALGMSKGQLTLKQFGTAALRGVLGVLIGWLAYGGYCIVWAIREQEKRLLDGKIFRTLWELVSEKLNEIARYWGGWQVALLLTALCIALILTISWLANRRLMKEDLMAKLRDEH